MDSIVILCGGNSSGKTSTLKGFFDVAEDEDSPSTFVKRELNGKTVCAVSFSSPQERLSMLKVEPKFCNFMEVQKGIKKRVSECVEKLNGKPYALLIPFTMSTSTLNRKKLNVNCIIKPIKELRQKFNVFVVYLRKTKAQNQKEKNEQFNREYGNVINIFTKRFIEDYCKNTGEIDWEKIVEFNSQKITKKNK